MSKIKPIEREYFEWHIQPKMSTIKPTDLGMDKIAMANYRTMSKPIKEGNEYAIRIIDRRYFQFSNGLIRLESTIYALLKTNIKDELFSEGDLKTDAILTDLLLIIENEIYEYVKNHQKDIYARYKKPSDSQVQNMAHDLLRSRLEWEN